MGDEEGADSEEFRHFVLETTRTLGSNVISDNLLPEIIYKTLKSLEENKENLFLENVGKFLYNHIICFAHE